MSMVEWKNLGDEMKVLRGKRLTKNLLDDNAEYPVFHGGIEPLGKYSQFNRDENTVMVINVGASAGTVGYCDKKFWSSDGCFCISHSDKVNSKYLFYYLQCKTHYLQSQVRYAGIPTLDNSVVEKIKIPFISLVEQKSIVEKLDTFTSSIENLKEQIAQRRKQYEYYRDQLLDLEGKEGVERYILKDVCEVINGRAYSQPELLSEGKYRVLRVGNFFSNDSWYYSDLDLDEKYYCEKGDLLYAWSASFGPHIWVGEKTIYHYHIWKMNCSDNIDKMFMYYWLQSEDMRKQAFSNLHGATMAHLTKSLMESLKVPVPPLQEQQRIVDILDTFEESIQNLEAQLAQREKQYEYYRNKLLTFE